MERGSDRTHSQIGEQVFNARLRVLVFQIISPHHMTLFDISRCLITRELYFSVSCSHKKSSIAYWRVLESPAKNEISPASCLV